MTVAAPSLIELEEAAVTVPPVLNAEFRRGILSSLIFLGDSSSSTVIVSFLVVTMTGTISCLK